jgi:stage III sporulation protein AD
MFIIFPYLTEVISLFRDLTNIIGEDNIGYISVILKIVGIAYVAEFGAQLCVDAGESAIASKIELSAKVIIMFMASPILMALLNSIFSMLL